MGYQTSYRTIYSNFTPLMIDATRSLAILGHISPDHEEKMGSWVPDWSRTLDVDPLSGIKGPYYSATGDSDV